MEEPLYRIGEAARLLELETYVLRFWETEFPQLRPLRTPKGQRKYTQHHLELLRLVKHLLHQQGMTIEGARKILDRKTDPFAAPGPEQTSNDFEPFDAETGTLPPPLPSPRTMQDPGQNGELRVTLVQGSLFPLPPGKDRRLLLELRQELEALRETLRTLET